jgi:signal transduction histidine kinase
MWRQVVLPVIIVGCSWFTMSVATTCYVLWLDTSYQRVFDENIKSATAAGHLQEEVWHLHAELLAKWDEKVDWVPRLAAFDKATREELNNLSDSVTTPEEQILADSVGQLTEQYRQRLAAALGPQQANSNDDYSLTQQAELFTLAALISDKSDRIRQINDELSQSATSRRIRIRNLVLWGRSFASFFISALGIAFGWWTANRLKRSVTRIQVTLHEPSLSAPDDLGTVHVRGGDELSNIQQQVGLVVDRLRRSGEELQAARQEVVRAERLAAIGGLAAGVAHELRNPLTSVKLLLQHAASRGGDAVVASTRMGLILDEIERMEATIQGLLDFSRPARPQRKLHDLRETLQRALNLVEGRAEKQHVSTELMLGAAPQMVNGDPQQLHQVFVNLLINGIEAMPQGGRLSVVLHDHPENGRIAVEIQDTGEGIPREVLPRLFEPFASNKERGTGLGLAVSRRIIEEHGGTVRARPRTPQGTAFEVALPKVAAMSHAS